ncbi:hypothetical protein NLI96_g12121 [Meripilus lineatus]|uniref:RlpA-like protein double-psi beta-barrel domain-containing protein n=1 Tax=Meripilus lineatus TaxID=2056292 RepID=A0AAD5YCQ2_9APHY|nr:hypothetical protein NLI96_g12121 [Physisporinus lineatus]
MVSFRTALFAGCVTSLLSFVVASPVESDVGLVERAAQITHSGRATWFNPGLGACGFVDGDNSPIVAISHLIYGSGGNCNQWMQVTNTANGKSVYVKTRDECEGCGQYDIDLSPSAFSSIGNLDTGVLNVQWHFMAKGWSP